MVRIMDIVPASKLRDIVRLQKELQHSEKSGDISLKDAFKKLGKKENK